MTCGQRHWRIVPSDKLTRETVIRMAEFFSERPESVVRKISYTPEYFLWKINKNPAGPGYVSLAMDEDRIVGILTLTRRRLWFRGREVMAAEMADGIVDQDYRGRGIHATLVEDTRTRALGDEVKLIYGIFDHNNISLRIHEKRCSSLRKPNMDLFIWVLPLRPVERLLGKSNGMESHIRSGVFEGVRAPKPNSQALDLAQHQDHRLRFDASFDRLNVTLRDRYDALFSRSAEDLKFRYVDNPEKESYRMLLKRDATDEIEAVLIYRSIIRDDLKVLFVTDLLGTDNDSVIDLWTNILYWGLTNDHDTVALWTTRRWFEQFGEFPYPPVPIVRREFVLFHNEPAEKLLKDDGLWYLSISDSTNI